MTPTDAGPLIALLDQSDKHHAACAAAARNFPRPLVTTWPCVTEAMYFLGKSRGHAAQDALWAMVIGGIVRIHALTESDMARMRALMVKYESTPMDLADASLVVMCETMNVRRIFTVDSDFVVYRLNGSTQFTIVP